LRNYLEKISGGIVAEDKEPQGGPDDPGGEEGEYGKQYSEKSFWEKLGGFALKAGREVVQSALVLFYCLVDNDTPHWARTVIVGALGYFIVPLDAIPDFTPAVGFADDLGVLVSALAVVALHIKGEHRKKAAEKLKLWFSE
jgi:uncharacterized membrane protein YkvA (DUF1232 family)